MPKVRRVENEPVGNALVRGEAELGVQQISELRGVKGVDYVGPFPDAVQRVSVFSVGIATKAPNPRGAKAFVDLVLSPAGQAVLKKAVWTQSRAEDLSVRGGMGLIAITMLPPA